MEVIKNECISKLEVVRILQKAYTEGKIQAKDGLVSILDDINAADVQPVRRGKWIEKAEDYYRQWQDSGRSWDDMPYFITGEHFACGVCFDKYEINAEGVEFWDFCPHCGADMRGEDNG